MARSLGLKSLLPDFVEGCHLNFGKIEKIVLMSCQMQSCLRQQEKFQKISYTILTKNLREEYLDKQ